MITLLLVVFSAAMGVGLVLFIGWGLAQASVGREFYNMDSRDEDINRLLHEEMKERADRFLAVSV